MSENRWTNMAGLSTEHDKKKKIDYGKIVAKFADIKMQKQTGL